MDLVYLWVDGSHPRSQAYRQKRGILSPYQVSNHGELQHSLRSVYMYAPWHRRIIVVSECGIVPAWASAVPAVEWVDQDTLLPADAIPCFNNMVLEAFLHRLPGLSEPFLYMNDDFFFGQPVAPEMWLQPSWTFFRGRSTIPATASPKHEWLHMTVRTADLCAALWGHRPTYLQHTPYLMSIAAMAAVLQAFPAVHEMARRCSKRHAQDVVPLLLMQEWVLHAAHQPAARTVVLQKHTTPRYFFANVQPHNYGAVLQEVVRHPYQFITLNDSFGAHAVVGRALQATLAQLWPRIRALEENREFASVGAALAWVREQAQPVWLQLGGTLPLPLERAKALVPSALKWDAVVFPASIQSGGQMRLQLRRITTVPIGIALLCLQPHVQLPSLRDLASVALYQPLPPVRRTASFGQVR